jgi:hypothetical protein
LHLPSGRTAGHRSLAKYYRQNLRNYPTPEERADQRALEGRHDSDDEEEARDNRGRQVVTRAEGGLGMVGASEVQKKEVRAAEKREKKREQRHLANYQWGNDRRGNNQKHFRVSFIIHDLAGILLTYSRTISCNRCVRSILQPLAVGLLHFLESVVCFKYIS